MRYVLQFDSIVPDPGIEKLSEMQEIVAIVNEGKAYSAEDEQAASSMIKEMGDHWCHRCDYCQPCPQGIGISGVLTVESIIRRFPFHQAKFFAQTNMEKAATCLDCGECVKRCPYELQIPALIKGRLELWQKTVADNS